MDSGVTLEMGDNLCSQLFCLVLPHFGGDPVRDSGAGTLYGIRGNVSYNYNVGYIVCDFHSSVHSSLGCRNG